MGTSVFVLPVPNDVLVTPVYYHLPLVLKHFIVTLLPPAAARADEAIICTTKHMSSKSCFMIRVTDGSEYEAQKR